MKIFATGKSGTIGSKLPSRVTPIDCDLKEIARYPEKQDFMDSAIIHLAGIVGIEKVKEDIQYSEKVNIKYTMNLAEVVAKHRASKFIYISSGHVYGNTEKHAIESQTLNPLTLYAEQKCRAEEQLTNFFRETATTLYILRVFSVINLENKNNSTSLGSQLHKIINGDRDIWIHNGEDVRDFMSVNGVSKILTKVAETFGPGGIYNVCSGTPMSVRELTNSTLEKHGIYNFSQIKDGFSSMKSNFGSRDKLTRTFLVDSTLKGAM